jgi:hypothetical protein
VTEFDAGLALGAFCGLVMGLTVAVLWQTLREYRNRYRR